jgi:hypothetical protein
MKVHAGWLRAGFAVYGGYEKRESAPAACRVAFDEAVRAADLALNAANQD